MSTAGRRATAAVAAVPFAVGAVCWLLVAAMNDSLPTWHRYLISATGMAMLATPWSIALPLLFARWSARQSASHPATDLAHVLLSVAAACMPTDRLEWGRAMLAELSAIDTASERWAFTLGCLHAALISPTSRVLWPWPLAAGFVAAAVSPAAVPPEAQSLRLLTSASAGLAATTLAAIAIHRQKRWRPPRGWTGAAFGVAATVACAGLALATVASAPAGADVLGLDEVVLVIAAHGALLWVTLSQPAWTNGDHRSVAIGLAAAALLALGIVPATIATLHTEGGPVIYLLFAPPALFFIAGLLASRMRRSERDGLRALLWTAIAASVLLFLVATPAAEYRYAVNARQLMDGECGLPAYANLSFVIWWSMAIPQILGIPFGILGVLRSTRTRSVAP
ncbi:MAG: hypothetical protein U0821_00965 [Chloroflexota bacterium]